MYSWLNSLVMTLLVTLGQPQALSVSYVIRKVSCLVGLPTVGGNQWGDECEHHHGTNVSSLKLSALFYTLLLPCMRLVPTTFAPYLMAFLFLTAHDHPDRMRVPRKPVFVSPLHSHTALLPQ